MDSYDSDEHGVRISSWAAVTAPRALKKCRFIRASGVILIDASGLSKMGKSWNDLPSPSAFDGFHRQLRNRLCEAAEELWEKKDHGFSHGVAAKLTNFYLKGMYLSDVGLDQAPQDVRNKSNALHPPVNRLLLAELASRNEGGRVNFWKKQMSKGWSSFTSEDYESTTRAECSGKSKSTG